MFSFFHRTSKITLDCLTTDESVYKYTPIVKASKTIPDWWKELPNCEFKLKRDKEKIFINDSVQNLKNCYGFLELFNNAISIRYWADLYLEISESDILYYTTSDRYPDQHSKEQIGNGFTNYHHLKLSSPWLFLEKEGVKFSWFGAQWNLDNYDFLVLPAVINFNITHHTNISIMIPKQNKSYVIPAGLPLVNLIPMSEKKLILKTHLVTKEEMSKYNYDNSFKYFHGWRTCKKFLDSEKKCQIEYGE